MPRKSTGCCYRHAGRSPFGVGCEGCNAHDPHRPHTGESRNDLSQQLLRECRERPPSSRLSDVMTVGLAFMVRELAAELVSLASQRGENVARHDCGYLQDRKSVV